MAHHVDLSAYNQLTERLNRFPQGAPPSEHLERILKILLSDEEASKVSQLPIKPFTAGQAARIWQLEESEASRMLNTLASRAVLVDIHGADGVQYVLPPPMAGFFEFSMMRTRDDLDQKLLAELFYQYLNVEEDFIKALFTDGETQLGRVFVQEAALKSDDSLQVLDYERATAVIEASEQVGISMCYCRHKMEHVGKNCDAPMDICMTFNTSAASLIRHGHARAVDKIEGRELLARAWEHNLVQFGENVRERVNFICNCCGCCCEAMLAAQRFAARHPIHTTNFQPAVNDLSCTGCGKCVDACPVQAMTLVSANAPHKPRRRQAKLAVELCLGCGVCVRSCPEQAIELALRPERVITPLNSAHRTVMMAIERGKLQELIFDNQLLFSHRALATFFGAIFKLPPLKQLLATKQVKSRYLEALMARR